MECGLGSPEQIAACIHIGQRWFQVLADIAGFSSLALITLLIWLFQRLRKDLTRWEDEATREKELRNYAENSATEARHRADLADSVASHARKEKEALEALLNSGSDELHKQLAEAQGRLLEASAKIDGTLELTGGGTGNYILDKSAKHERFSHPTGRHRNFDD